MKRFLLTLAGIFARFRYTRRRSMVVDCLIAASERAENGER